MAKDLIDSVFEHIERCLVSPNVLDSNYEPANVVDVIDRLSTSVLRVAKSITPTDALAGEDSAGIRVSSLTEAVMGVSAGMMRIAEAIEHLSDSVREHSAKES